VRAVTQTRRMTAHKECHVLAEDRHGKFCKLECLPASTDTSVSSRQRSKMAIDSQTKELAATCRYRHFRRQNPVD